MTSKINIRKTVFAGVIAALYAALTIALAPISYGEIQFRIAEVLCIMPFFFPAAVPGLFVGCIIANMFSPYGLLDMIAGSFASLFAALCTMLIAGMGKEKIFVKAFACFPPVAFNAVIIGAVIAWTITEGASEFWAALVTFGLWVGFGQLVVLYALGLPLLVYLPKTQIIIKLQNLYDGGK